MQYVYHGSYIPNLKIIKRNNSTHNQALVYATHSKIIAAIFSSKKHSDLYYSLSGNGITSKITLVERKKGMFKDIFNTKGYIYSLDKKNFQIGKTGWSAEVVSTCDEKVIKEEVITNIYNELIKQNKKGNIALYLYPNRPSFIPLDNSDLIPKIAKYHKDSNIVKAFIELYPELKDKLYKEIEKST